MSFVKLAYKTFAAKNGNNVPFKKNNIYIAHGLLGNAMNWASVAKRMLEEPELANKIDTIYSFEMRNHGDSPHTDDHSNAALASDLEAIILEHYTKEPPLEQKEHHKLYVSMTSNNEDSCYEENTNNRRRGSVFIGHSMGGLALIGMLLRRYNDRILLQQDVRMTHIQDHLNDSIDKNINDDKKHEFMNAEEMKKLNFIWSADRRAAYSAYMRKVNTHFGFAENESLQPILFSDTYNQLGHLSAAIIVDITPTTMLSESTHYSMNTKFNDKNKNNSNSAMCDNATGANCTESIDSNLHTLHAMQAAQLDRIHSYTEADVELKRVGISDVALRSFVATNIVLNKDRTKPAHWRCNLDVLAENFKSFQPSIVNWFEHYDKLPTSAGSSANLPHAAKHDSHIDTRGNGDNHVACIAPRPCLLPTLFVFGEKSIYNNSSDRQKIPTMFPFSTQVVVPKAGHFVHYEQREGFVNAIVPFLSQYL